MTTTIVGEGILSWPREERVSDRYGCIMLMVDGDSLTDPSRYVPIDFSLGGHEGTLVAEVLVTRTSTHIGDLFRGLFPETPQRGERVVLGTGTVWVEQAEWGATLIGLQPHDDRRSDWLDPKALYRCHEQTVRLVLEEKS